MTNMLQECKVFFPLEFTREEAESVVRRYDPKATFDNYWTKKEIGSQTHTFAVVTLPISASTKLIDDVNVKNIEVITQFAGVRSCGEGGCGCK